VHYFASLVVTNAAFAQDANYPSRPINWIVPMGAGGTSDVFARTIQPFMANYLGQPMVIENKSGANGVLGEELGFNAKPDGYTLIFSSASIAANPFLRKTNYDPRKFVPVIYLGNVYLILLANNDVKASNLKEFVDMVKAKPPGTYNYSSWGVGGMGHLATELLNIEAKINLSHIPYKSSPEAVTAAISGQTQVSFQTTSLAIPQIKAGRLHGLAIAAPNRLTDAPDVPTVAEMGFPGIKIDTWFGIFLPPNTPRPIVDRLNKAFQAAIADPEIKGKLEAKGIYPKGGSQKIFKLTSSLKCVNLTVS
jgi:tripartite-type tricarboxylate transporter receptor subunit TctC